MIGTDRKPKHYKQTFFCKLCNSLVIDKNGQIKLSFNVKLAIDTILQKQDQRTKEMQPFCNWEP